MQNKIPNYKWWKQPEELSSVFLISADEMTWPPQFKRMKQTQIVDTFICLILFVKPGFVLYGPIVIMFGLDWTKVHPTNCAFHLRSLNSCYPHPHSAILDMRRRTLFGRFGKEPRRKKFSSSRMKPRWGPQCFAFEINRVMAWLLADWFFGTTANDE